MNCSEQREAGGILSHLRYAMYVHMYGYRVHLPTPKAEWYLFRRYRICLSLSHFAPHAQQKPCIEWCSTKRVEQDLDTSIPSTISALPAKPRSWKSVTPRGAGDPFVDHENYSRWKSNPATEESTPTPGRPAIGLDRYRESTFTAPFPATCFPGPHLVSHMHR